jgi:hypothetical protein
VPPTARPVFALGLVTVVLTGILTVRYSRHFPKVSTPQSEADVIPGSAVGDLQMLEEVEKVAGDSDLLDDLAPGQQDLANQD